MTEVRRTKEKFLDEENVYIVKKLKPTINNVNIFREP